MPPRIDSELFLEIVEAVDVEEPGDLVRPLGEYVKELAGDERASGIRLLGDVMSYYGTPENRHRPFRANVIWEGKRSAEPDDLTEEQLADLAAALPKITIPMVSARIADVLWLRLRQPEFADTAVPSYLAWALEVESTTGWTLCHHAILRAATIAAQLKSGRPALLKRVMEHCEEVLDRIAETDQLFLSLHLTELLVEHKHGDMEAHAGRAEFFAEQATTHGDHQRARGYWRLLVLIARRLGETERLQAALSSVAESYHSQSRATAEPIARVHWLGKAIAAFNHVEDSSARREALAVELQEAQSGITESLHPVRLPDELVEQQAELVARGAEETQERLSSASVFDSLVILAFDLFQPINFTQLRQTTREQDQRSVFADIVVPSLIDKHGRTVARGSTDESGVMPSSLARNANVYRDLVIHGYLLPALGAIEQQHYVSERYVYEHIVEHAPFVPPSNVAIVSKGLWMGLVGDFVGATTILVPQVEECIRHVLRNRGFRVSSYGAESVEKFRHLPTLLGLKPVRAILGEDIVEDLDLILVNPEGGNLRAAVAHGFVDDHECNSPESIFVWWHVLRLVLKIESPELGRQESEAKEDAET